MKTRNSPMFSVKRRLINKKLIIVFTAVAISVVLLVCVIVIVKNSFKNDVSKSYSKEPVKIHKKAAVATIGPECASIGSDIMQHKNGSAVDAAIAALLCEGVATPQSMGIGGGFFMTIYDAPSGKVDFLDARETAPGLANTTMYGGNASLNYYGALAVAVPGEIQGYWEAHRKYGRVPWEELFEPTIQLCEIGTIVTKNLENNLKIVEKFIRDEPSLSEIFINSETNQLYSVRVGERIKRPKLAETFRKLANAKDPVDVFYKGEIAKLMVDDIQKFGGIITREDLSNYKVKWKSPIESKIDNMTIYTAPPPGSGVLLTFIINILKDITPVDDPKIMWQRVIETFKWAFAKRTELGDPDFVEISDLVDALNTQEFANTVRSRIHDDKTYTDPAHYGAVNSLTDDYGTAHVSVLAPDGSAVSVTSTINQILGAKIRSITTGIIFNNEMDDFSSSNITNGFEVPPSPHNFIKPYKRPLSSMAPTIVLDDDRKVRLILGGVGGTKITTALASVILLHLRLNYTIEEAVDAPRLHHQLIPMQVEHEDGFSASELNYLQKIGHKIVPATFTSGIIAIANSNGQITANPDRIRKGGAVSGF